ncbi:MAG: lipoyl(octanoyl) transferase LipB [Deltaproteobacteria bacterium]|nr:lipoyl(octanoyl) transferase LipB [Deltaproteobacteria bacterium]
MKVSESFLEERGISVIHVERGGDITYHGPGQLVIYPIIHLRGTGLDVYGYITRLEEVMIRTAGDFGVGAERDPKNRGAWVRGSKIGSIGIAIRHGITFHGLALNINTSLEHFTWIHPCGLQDIRMTSLAKELGSRVPMEEARRSARKSMEDVFGIELVGMEIQDIAPMLPGFVIKEAPGPGMPLFDLDLEAEVPVGASIARLKEELAALASEENLDLRCTSKR